MVLGSDKIFELIKEKELLINLPDEFKIEGATVDVRLGKVWKHDGEAVLFEDKRNTGKVVEVTPDRRENRRVYYIEPGQVYLVSTIEEVKMPDNLIALIDTRTTMFRSGLILKATYTNPGYHGPLTFMVVNHTKKMVQMERGFRIAQMAFFEIKGSVEPYHGQWQGGKVHTDFNFVGPR